MASTPVASFRADPTVPARPEAGPSEFPSGPLTLFGFECSLDTTPIDTLEGVARSMTRARVAAGFARRPSTEEVVLLATCHRIEVVGLARDSEEVERWRDLLPGPTAAWRFREGREVVRHLFRVAAGRESLAVGEAEAGQQVRAAGHSILSRHPRPVLREVFSRATEELPRASEPDTRSIAAFATEHLRELLPGGSPRVLVVGSGTVGRQVTRRLASHARVTVVYHERPPADSFLRATDANTVPLDRLRESAATADAIVTAAKFGNHGLRASDLPTGRPIVLVDLGMPRNIDPAVRALPSVRLIDLQELYELSRSSSDRAGIDLRLEELADRCSDRLERLLWEPWVSAWYRAAESLRRSELENARDFLGPLTSDQEVAVDRLTRRLVSRLLLPPTERFRSLPPGPAGERQRRLARELFRFSASDP